MHTRDEVGEHASVGEDCREVVGITGHWSYEEIAIRSRLEFSA
jgi:hypothetical protein